MTYFLPTDVPPLVDSVFLELPGLDRNLPLPFHLCGDGSGLPGVHVRVHIQTSAARNPSAHSVPGAAGFPQGETQHHILYTQHPVKLL